MGRLDTTEPTALAAPAEPLTSSVRPATYRSSGRLWLPASRFTTVFGDLVAAFIAVVLARNWRAEPLPELVVGSGLTYDELSKVAIPLWVGLLTVAGTYRWRRVHGLLGEGVRVANAGVGMLAVVAVGNLAWRLEISRTYVAIGVGAAVVLSFALRIAMRTALRVLRRFGRCEERVLLVGQALAVDDLAAHLLSHRRHGYRVVERLVSGPEVLDRPAASADDVDVVVRAIDACRASLVVVAGPNAFPPGGARLLLARLALQAAGGGPTADGPAADGPAVGGRVAGAGSSLGVVADAQRRRRRPPSGRVEVVFAPEVTELSSPGAVVRRVSNLLLLEVPARTGFGYVVTKRTLDIFAAAVGLVLLAPLLGVLALLVRTGSPGPALFRQPRVGRNGRTFLVAKFRSMVSDAEDRLRRDGLYEEYVANDFKLAPERDPRITRIGRFLRRTSLDELPQLWNVLKGEMSLVGPRPVVVDELARYGNRAPAYLALRPGLTGYWQVNGRSNVAFPERAELDEYYFENRSMALDLTILARTVVRVVQGDGAH